MKKLILLFVLFCIGAVNVKAQEKNFIDLNYVEVTGSAIIKAIPDIAYINIVISEDDVATKSIGIEKAEKKMFAALTELKIDIEKDLSINDMTSNFVRRKGVSINKNYTLKLKNTKQISDLYSKLDKAGISNVDVERFELSNLDELRLKTKATAVANAKAKAAILVEAAGRKLGEVLYIVDYERDIMPTGRMMSRKMVLSSEMVNDAAPAPEVDVKEIEVVGSITTRWRIL